MEIHFQRKYIQRRTHWYQTTPSTISSTINKDSLKEKDIRESFARSPNSVLLVVTKHKRLSRS